MHPDSSIEEEDEIERNSLTETIEIESDTESSMSDDEYLQPNRRETNKNLINLSNISHTSEEDNSNSI